MSCGIRFRRGVQDKDMPLIDGLTRLYHSFGYECTKRNNMQPITDSIVLHSNGIHIQALAPPSFVHVHARTCAHTLAWRCSFSTWRRSHKSICRDSTAAASARSASTRPAGECSHGVSGIGVSAICIHPSSR